MRRLIGISGQRTLPRFARRGIKGSRDRGIKGKNGRVVLFADCFTTYNEPRVVRAAMRVLEHIGYEVEVRPRAGEGGFGGGCCGRSMISVGMLAEAAATAEKTIESLRSAIESDEIDAILVCEPSCLSAFKDDWLQLRMDVDLALRKRLAMKAVLVEEFVGRKMGDNAPQIRGAPVLLHGHCHQKALWGAETSAGALRRVAGENVVVLDTGCCGMAGSFGYDADKYDLSMKIGELVLFPAVRAAKADAIIVAPGTSCRHQIRDGTGREALHPIEVIAMALFGDDNGNGDGRA
jgi:Fe-S oxidoreductase